MANSFGLGGFSGTVPSYGGSINMGGLADRINQGGIAGGYGLDKERLKQFQDLFGDKEMAGLFYIASEQQRAANDSENLRKKLDVIEPYYRRIGEQSQKFGLQSNLIGAGINAINKIPDTINAMRAIPLQGLYQQANTVPNIFGQYGTGRPGFSGIRGRLGVS